MVEMRNHGGSCCGTRHLVGFRDAEERDVHLITTAQQQVPDGRMTEIILNNTQATRRPRTLQRMAEMGYVLVGKFTNDNTGSLCYVFHRMDKRHPLVDANGQCVLPGWQGQIISARLAGNLPSVTQNNRTNDRHYVRDLPPGVIRGPARVDPNAMNIGSAVTINSPTSQYNGCPGVISGALDYDSRYGVRITEGPFVGRVVRIVRSNLRLVNPAVQPEDTSNGGRRPVVNARVQWRGGNQNRYTNGTYGTITQVHNQGQHVYVRWDNPDLPQPGNWIDMREIFLVPGEAVARIEPPANANPGQRHATQPDDPRAARAQRPGDAPAPVQAAQPAPVAPPLVAIFQTFHNVYRDGRRGAGYDTYELALAARQNGRGRVDRRSIRNDGSVAWTENFGG